MTDAINSNNRVKSPTLSADQRAKSTPKETNTSSAPGNSASAVVDLSSSQIMQKMESIPEVNTSRVEAIKNAIANGEYQPDPEVIARKFAEIEKLLP